jgi:hypothetical protein
MNKKNIFLLDGIGATLSGIATGLILPLYAEWIGLSTQTLHLLGCLAFVFAVYSLTCFWIVQRTKPFMLAGIMVANILYCILAVCIAFLVDELTTLGRVYFLGEAMVISGIVVLESRVYSEKIAS